MTNSLTRAGLALLLAGTLALPPLTAAAQDPPPKEAGKEAPKDDKKPEPPKSFTAERAATINGQKVTYTVVAGETRLKNDKDEEVASVFSTAYFRTGVKDPANRPVTFLFNGGPGSASLWLHMGVYGPKRIQVPGDGGNAGAPPYPVVDNAQSILDVTDLVFIDPVGTGYSRVVGKGEEKDFYGVEEDARSVAKFIRQWLTANKRWNAPKYLGGESYGAVRTAAVAKELARADSWVALNGLLLISGAVDLGALDFSPGSDVAYWSFLPTYAATAWHHGKVADTSKGLDAFLAEARRFALDEYAPALLKGNRLTPEERSAMAARLAGFTGLSRTFIERANLRVSGERFQKELLRDQGKTVGRFDTRYLGDDYDSAGEGIDNDPSLYGIAGAYTSSVNAYFAELGIDMGREYKVLSGLWPKWNWKVGPGRQGDLNVAPWIGQAMRENTALRTFAAMGYHDLATPMFAVENSLAGPGIPKDRVVFTYYQGGHMMYVHQPSLEKLAQDTRQFIAAGQPAGQ